MKPAELPIARELFTQWRRARGTLDARTRPFTRAWEALLEDACVLSAIDREEAVRDARALESGGWLEVRTARYRPGQIERVVLPLSAEARWMAAFAFEPRSEAENARTRAFAWVPELAFLRETRIGLPFEDLRRIDAFLRAGGAARELVPIKERSLELFGEEKRLDGLLGSALFGPGRLNPGLLRVLAAAEPLGWVRGPATAASGPVIVLENAATWHTYARWNRIKPQFSAVIYGGGNRFIEGVGFLREIFEELGGTREVYYFGDLDPQGLRIPQLASVCSQAAGLPEVRPHRWSYARMLALAQGKGQPCDDPTAKADLETLAAWLGESSVPALDIMRRGTRLAQEMVGWEILRNAG
jgi:hypothetical protein